MALIRYYSAFFQDQLQTPHIGDVLERIGPDHNKVGELRIAFAQILVCWSSPTTKCVRRWGGKDVPL
jgi:hypothetical protein